MPATNEKPPQKVCHPRGVNLNKLACNLAVLYRRCRRHLCLQVALDPLAAFVWTSATWPLPSGASQLFWQARGHRHTHAHALVHGQTRRLVRPSPSLTYLGLYSSPYSFIAPNCKPPQPMLAAAVALCSWPSSSSSSSSSPAASPYSSSFCLSSLTMATKRPTTS